MTARTRRDVTDAVDAQTSFAGRLRAARALLGRPIGSGSGRAVFDLGDGAVLKVAKNPRGVAQNEIESDGYVQQAYSDLVAPVLDSDPNHDLWLVMAKARKVDAKRFRQLSGIASRWIMVSPLQVVDGKQRPATYTKLAAHYRLLHALRSLWAQEHGKKEWSALSEEEAAEILSAPLAGRLADLMRDADMPPGDFGRLSTYGELDGRLVLVDYGLSSGVWKEFYEHDRARFWGGPTEP